jgi:3',5'-cyclic AMP phosphodiesterase CpdA
MVAGEVGPQVVSFAHVSDVHFGADEPAVVAALQRALTELAPALIVVSGDLTQRARARQYRTARRWLDGLPAPYLVVPGNHDIPLFDVVRRMLFPLRRYHKYITEDMTPVWTGEGVRVLGLDSTRRRTSGRLNPERLRAVAELSQGEPSDLRVLVTHHPVTERHTSGYLDALEAAALAHADQLLAGHTHSTWRRRVKEDPGLGILQVQAGTATSHRRRKEHPVNTFNVLRWDAPVLDVELWNFADGAFARADEAVFRRGERRWETVQRP